MCRIIDYKILKAEKYSDLELAVKTYIKEGWSLYGSLSFFRTETDTDITHIYVREIVKYAIDEPVNNVQTDQT